MDIYQSTCLGCLYLDQNYEEDYSEVTPGMGYYCDCNAGHFQDLKASETYMLIGYRQNCPDFDFDTSIPEKIKERLEMEK